jgi:hypothetical protein
LCEVGTITKTTTNMLAFATQSLEHHSHWQAAFTYIKWKYIVLNLWNRKYDLQYELS